jgi:hypothetical protein
VIGDDIKSALTSIFSGRVYPDVGPFDARRIFCIYQRIGGVSLSTFCGETTRANAVYQVTVWGDTRLSVDAAMVSVSAALTASTLKGVPQSGAVDRYDDITKAYGSMRDFSFWS